MRYMMMIKATPEYEAGQPPNPELMAGMAALSGEMMKQGKLVAAEGLLPSAHGFRLAYRGGKRSVIDGPFAEAKELIGGFAILEAASKEEALALATRALDVHIAAGVPAVEMEIRPVVGAPGPAPGKP
jgi:hypothetical protein